jgi:hypothetical protein
VASIFRVDEKVKEETSVKTCGSRLYGVMSQKITLQMEKYSILEQILGVPDL